MAKIFGTDGVRGVANSELTCELVIKLVREAAFVLKDKFKNKKIIILRDTRISSEMFEHAVAAGVCSSGMNALILGIMPTPAASFLVKKMQAAAAVVISASHNPFEFNGIKFFDGDGYKLNDETERQIEENVNEPKNSNLPVGGELGKVFYEDAAIESYTEHLAQKFTEDLCNLKVAVDCANGAASVCARSLFRKLGIEYELLFDSPDGTNINRNCGSTNLNALAQRVVDGGFDLGVAFDGDADRCLAVDEKGRILDGDHIMAACGLDLFKSGKLMKNSIVGTPMSNLGFVNFLEKSGIRFVETKIGDKHISKKILENGYNFGGEQSGHMIFNDVSSTGDGLLTAILFINTLIKNNFKASEVFEMFIKFPQFIKNITVKKEDDFFENSKIKEVINQSEKILGGSGRVFVRKSGTEPMVRIMVQSGEKDLFEEVRRLYEQPWN
ncbi:MAG: phosphoglucosamine mutase [Oscillospiraceae bacterium]|jgi:phosphoglucosamine mutase|nr:phosphoglucosamine mutase [Oscillospiraceae bacterium]